MTDIETLLDAVTDRLDKQARAIKDLRARVAALESTGATASTGAGEGVALPPTCLMCGQDKGGRVGLMTCKPCSTKRTLALKENTVLSRASITVTECLLCHKPRGRTTQLVCSRCRDGIKAWKATL